MQKQLESRVGGASHRCCSFEGRACILIVRHTEPHYISLKMTYSAYDRPRSSTGPINKKHGGTIGAPTQLTSSVVWRHQAQGYMSALSVALLVTKFLCQKFALGFRPFEKRVFTEHLSALERGSFCGAWKRPSLRFVKKVFLETRWFLPRRLPRKEGLFWTPLRPRKRVFFQVLEKDRLYVKKRGSFWNFFWEITEKTVFASRKEGLYVTKKDRLFERGSFDSKQRVFTRTQNTVRKRVFTKVLLKRGSFLAKKTVFFQREKRQE